MKTTLYKAKKVKRKKKHGFFSRTQSKSGRKVLSRRRNKGRAKLTV